MVNQSFYRLAEDIGCNLKVSDKFLMVNCTGIYGLSEPFCSSSQTGRQDTYLMYLVSGSLNIEIAGRECQLNSGDIAFYPKDTPYRYSKTDNEFLTYYWVHFSGYGENELLSSCNFEQGRVYTVGQSEKIASSFKHLFQYFYSREPHYELETAAQLTKILTQMSRAVSRDLSIPDVSTERIHKSLEYLYCNYAKQVTISQLAALEHLSISRYCAVFKLCMGISPQGFLINLRMKNAADLMQKTNLSIKQVAQIVGYDDPLYFSVLFKRKTGVTPSLYRG